MKDVDERVELMKLKLKARTDDQMQATLQRQRVNASKLEEEERSSYLSSFNMVESDPTPQSKSKRK